MPAFRCLVSVGELLMSPCSLTTKSYKVAQLLSLSKVCQSSTSLASAVRFPLKIKTSSVQCTLEILFHGEAEARGL